jgi:hypothetical protein
VVTGAPLDQNSQHEEGRAVVYAGCVGACEQNPAITVADPGEADEHNTWSLIAGPTNEDIIWLWASSLAPSPVPGCPGLTLALNQPKRLGSRTTDHTGGADFGLSVPAAASGNTMHVQVLFPDSCVISNVATTVFP